MNASATKNVLNIFQRTWTLKNPAPLLGSGKEMRHSDLILQIEHMEFKNIELRPCKRCPKTG